MNTVKLIPLRDNDRDRFILDNQKAFKYGATEEFGVRDEHYEEDGEIISRKTIEESIDNGQAFRITCDGENVGGLVIKVDGTKGDLELLFVSPEIHSKGIGYAAWCEVEKMFPDVKEWTTCTPYFEQRNIHFYVNRCGFHVVEYFNKHHPGLEDPEVNDDHRNEPNDEDSGMFLFKKTIGNVPAPQQVENGKVLTSAEKRLRFLALFSFVISPLLVWGSVIASDETAVFASLSRLIWYSGCPWKILISMIVLFLPMLFSFFSALKLSNMDSRKKTVCKVLMLAACAILYIGAMEMMPSDGTTMTRINIWHGVMSFGGMLLIFLTYCLYATLSYRWDKDGAFLIICLLVFTLISGAFAVLNVFDDSSYVIASAVAEVYILMMFNIMGYLTYYLGYRKEKMR